MLKDIKTGDQLFSIVYKAYYIDDKLVGTGDILLAVSYKIVVKHLAIRFTNTGHSDYSYPEGVSLKTSI